MFNFFLNVHSGWRFVVLLALLINFLYFAYVLASKAQDGKQDRRVSLLFSTAADIQVTLGLILLVIVIIDGTFDAGKHLGHLFPMVLAAGASHAHMNVTRRVPALQTQRIAGLLAPVVTIILILAGLAALDGIGLFTMS